MSQRPADVPFTIPLTDPLYHKPPYSYEGARSFLFIILTSPETLDGLTPSPLVPMELLGHFPIQGMMLQCNVYTQPEGSLLEAVFALMARFDQPGHPKDGTTGLYIPYAYVGREGDFVIDDVFAVGREMTGYPKKEARIQFSEDDDTATFQISRGGHPLIDASMTKTFDFCEPEWLPLPKGSFNYKLIPSIVEDAGPEVEQLTYTPVIIQNPHDANISLQTRVTLHSSPIDNVADKIDVIATPGGFMLTSHYTLSYGEILYDYLQEE